MPHVDTFIAKLVSQAGDRYIFGHEVKLSDTDPSAFDCSELVEWAAWQVGVQPRVPDGSWYQARHCQKHGTLIPVSEALKTKGALLFRFSSSPFTGGRPTSSHVAVSLGDGRTIEAKGSRYGVGIFTAEGRGWTHAGLVPGLDYSTIEEEEVSLKETLIDMAFAAGWAEPAAGVSEDDAKNYWYGIDPNSEEWQDMRSAIVRGASTLRSNADGTKALQTIAKMKAVM